MIDATDPNPRSSALIVTFTDIRHDDLARVGGKGLNLGKLCQAGAPVPPGFCVTTHAFDRFVADDPVYEAFLDELEHLRAGDLSGARDLGGRLREHLGGRRLPIEVADAVERQWRTLGEHGQYAVRSSATAEDLPTASFAGQQDTYLNVHGLSSLHTRVRDCFASLYSDRAILYRAEQRIAHREVALCVVVQTMVHADRSGILFTADPITGHRDVLAIDAGFGLGESLVSGLVSADLYKIDKRDRRLLSTRVGDKKLAIRPDPDSPGGTITVDLDEDSRHARVLDDRDIEALTDVGLRIERMYGSPQDIEWCIDRNGAVYVVQTRPITSLYPIPVSPTRTDGDHGHPDGDPLKTYFCFNHFQVMTDAMPAMSLSFWQLLLPFGRNVGEVRYSPWSATAGGRLFFDLSEALRLPPTRKAVVTALAHIDELAGRSVQALWERDAFQRGPRLSWSRALRLMAPMGFTVLDWLLFRDTRGQAARTRAWIDDLVRGIRSDVEQADSLLHKLHAARDALGNLTTTLLTLPPQVFAGIVAGKLLARRSGVSNDDLAALARGLTGNVTTAMDLAIGDLADLAGAYPTLAARLAEPQTTMDDIRAMPGTAPFVDAMDGFLAEYGMRAPSEIDPARPRWRDDPRSILRTIAGNLTHEQPGAHRAHHAALAQRADEVAERIVASSRRGVFGAVRARLVRRLIDTHRHLTALREHPKFALVQVIDIARDVVIAAGRRLHAQGRILDSSDVWHLRLDELIAAIKHPDLDVSTRIAARVLDHEHHKQLAPPRVITSRGEIPRVHHDRTGMPERALVGSPASSGRIEGIAHVIRDPTTEVLKRGEILVAPFTDPGWTPLFINASGLVMEVGGLMTHGSVVAREYGIPAVVCIPDATSAIQTGMRIRIDGDAGYVEILEPAPS